MNDISRSAKQMVAAALKRLPENNYEAAELAGVSEGTIRRWREGKVPDQLRAETRRALAAFIEGGSVDGGARNGAEHPTPDDRALFEEVKAILRDQAIPPGMRVLLIDAATSAYTKAALYRGAVAEEERARAVLQAEKTQQTRTQVIGRVEELANERMREMGRSEEAATRQGELRRVAGGGVISAASGQGAPISEEEVAEHGGDPPRRPDE